MVDPTMRILYLLPQPYMLARGSSFRALATVKALSACGASVDLLSYPLGKEMSPVEGVTVVRWRCVLPFKAIKIGPSIKKVLIDIPFFFRAFYQMATRKYDVIHGVEEAGIFAAILSKLFGKPYVYDMHSWMSQQLEESAFIKSRAIISLFKKVEIYCMKNAAAVITVGPAMVKIINQVAVEVPAYALHDCSLDISLDVDKADVDAIRTRYNLESKVVFLYTGNFEVYQGIDLLLQSFRTFIEKVSEKDRYVLLLVGGGDESSQVVFKYKELAQELGLAPHVVFAGEWPVEAMPAFMNLASFVVSPRTLGNNVPLKIYTYMASGKPIIATDIVTHTQVLNESNSILRQATPEHFAEGLVFAVDPDNAERIRQLAAAAQKHAEADSDRKEFNSVVKKCYSKIAIKFTAMAELALELCPFVL